MVPGAMIASFLLGSAHVANGHGTVTLPAMRDNPTAKDGWCPWCQGEMQYCKDADMAHCAPPSPCWGATPGETVSPRKFFGYFNGNPRHPDGSHWIDQSGGVLQPKPVWCPGTTKTIRYYINTDHNGVFRWETQRAEPGAETEEAFSNITSWVSVNNYLAYDGGILTNYYNAIEKGNHMIPSGKCVSRDDWTNDNENCLNDVFAETTLKLPSNMEPGQTVFRWRWFGAMDADAHMIDGPERSLFVNCLDVEVGTPAQCSAVTGGEASV